MLRAAADADPDHEAFVDGGTGERLTFGAWDRAAEGVAAGLHALGVRKGDVVCLVLPSSIDYAVAYQGAMRLGAITSGVNPRLGPREKANILERTTPRVTIVDPALVDASALAPVSTHLLDRAQVRAWWAHDPRPASARPPLDPTDPMAIVWTSGTTGLPKGALFDHGCLEAMAAAAGELTAPGDRKLSPLPFAHIGYMTRPWDEISNFVTTIICATPWRADETLALIERERVTLCQGVPTQYELLLRHPDFDRTDFSSLRLVGFGASRIPPELVREARRRFGAPCIVRFASTETSVCTGTRLDDDDETIATTVGRPGAGVTVELRDDSRRAVPTGQVGTVWVRSRARMLGYWNDPERTAEAITPDGWLVTGDLGRFDGRGVLTLVGRRTEMYIRGGYNVYPAEVENLLGDDPHVARIAVVGVPAPVLGEIGVAFVVPAPGWDTPPAGSVLQPGDRGLCDALRDACRAQLADYKAPDRVVVVGDLPLTSMQKVDKAALQQQWAALAK